jgi:hypothetical protein
MKQSDKSGETKISTNADYTCYEAEISTEHTEKAPCGAFSLLAIQRTIAESSYINKLRQSEYVLARNPIYIGLIK